MTNKIEKLLEEMNKKLEGLLLAFALKEEKREEKAKILKSGGLNQIQIINLIGISDSTKRARKHRAKKK